MKKIFSLLLSLTVVASAWADVTFKARVEGGNTVEAGMRFQVEYEINTTCDAFDCDMSGCGVRAISGPFSSSFMSRSMTNGKTEVINTTTYTYVMVADKEGSFTLPAAKATVGGKVYRSNTIALTVIPADPNKQQSQTSRSSQQGRSSASSSTGSVGKDDILLAVDLSKTTVYEGEALVATLKLYFRNENVVSLQDVKFPDLEGFTAQEMDLGNNVQTTIEQYKGGNYRAYPVRQWLLFPQRAGNITIKPGSLTAIAQVYTGRRSFWDDPFNVYQNVQVPVTSPERVVKVNPVPAGKPASYMNAVGAFKIKGELTADKVKANDAVIYRLTIEGTGNLKYIREPHPEFPADFEVYDPKSDLQTRTTKNGLTGKRIIEYTIIPRFAGTFTIPPVEFSYFNTAAGKYETLTTDAFELEVEKGAGDTSAASGSSVDFSGTTQERIRVLGNDIRYLHNIDESELVADKVPVIKSPFYWLWFAVPALALLILLAANHRRLKRKADSVGQRTRKANKVASKRLKSASAALKQKDEAAFYEAVHKAMFGYVSDKLNLHLSDLTREMIHDELIKKEVDEETVKQYEHVIEVCEFARYAPSTDDQAMDKLYEDAVRTIDRLEKVL